MKLLHLSDLHIGKLLFEYSMLGDQQYWCRQVVDFLKENRHDAVLLVGDLYDRSVPPADAVALLDGFLCELVQQLQLPVLAVSGNHDNGRRLGFGSSLYRDSGLYMAAVPQAQIERVTLRDNDGEVDFWLLPYVTPADAKNLFPEREVNSYHTAYQAFIAENHPRMDNNRRNVLLAHGFFSRLSAGVAVDAITSDSEVTIGGIDITDAAIFAEFDYCAFGHLHAPQQVGSARMRYSGSPLCYSVSEEHQKKALLSVTLDSDGAVTAEQLSLLPLHRLYSVSGTLEQLSAATGGMQASQDYVFVNIETEGTELAAAERVRALYPNYLGIRYHNAAEQQVLLGGGGLQQKRSLPDTFSEFFTLVSGRELSVAERGMVQSAAESAQNNERGGAL